MSKKLIPYDELGFRILLLNPPMLKLPDGSKVPSPNMKKLQAAAFKALAEKLSKLSGDEVRFIRKYLRMTQVDFAKWLNMSNHSVVSQWEGREEHLSGMDYNTEVLLRLQMEGHLSKKSTISVRRLERLRELSSEEARITLNVGAA